jgi:hypothetical protein
MDDQGGMDRHRRCPGTHQQRLHLGASRNRHASLLELTIFSLRCQGDKLRNRWKLLPKTSSRRCHSAAHSQADPARVLLLQLRSDGTRSATVSDRRDEWACSGAGTRRRLAFPSARQGGNAVRLSNQSRIETKNWPTTTRHQRVSSLPLAAPWHLWSPDGRPA